MERSNKLRVKSGCRTCRARKIKCDEGRPVCQRCIASKRFCNGYGIWGGGSVAPDNRVSIPASNALAMRSPRLLPSADLETTVSFGWYRAETLKKLPGSFISYFWEKLVLQAGFGEPPVRHALVALSLVHQRGVRMNANHNSPAVKDLERNVLRHYVDAIQALQPHMASKEKGSLRVALTACLIFIGLEIYRGHFDAALGHLRNGLNVLRDSQLWANDSTCAEAWTHPSSDSTDMWIVKSFARLQFQVELFRFQYQGACLIKLAPFDETGYGAISSINDAWQYLQLFYNEIFLLMQQSRQLSDPSSTESFSTLVQKQQRIQGNLRRWLFKHDLLRTSLLGSQPAATAKGICLNLLYYKMAVILANTCLTPGDECVYDNHDTQFLDLMNYLADLWVTANVEWDVDTIPVGRPGHQIHMSQSYLDLGWIPALYFVAVKCRVHRIRVHAIRLLETGSHREGVWDAAVTACVARKVLEMEERDFYDDVDLDEGFALSSYATAKDLSLPLIPGSHRIRSVDMRLSGDPTDTVLLFGGRSDRSDNVLLSEYSVAEQRWIDA